MPRIKQRRFHVYDGTTLSYRGLGYDPPLTPDEESAIPMETREQRRSREHEYEIATWIDGPREGEEGIVFVVGDNWIPAHWPSKVLPVPARSCPVPDGET